MFGLKKNTLYTIAVLIFVASLILFFYSVKSNFKGLGATIKKYEFPGEVDVQLSEVGDYSIYHEYISRIDGKEVDNNELNISSIKVKLVNASTGENVELSQPDSYKKYNYRGRAGVKMLQFQNESVGEYRLKSSLKGLEKPDKYVLTLEKGFEVKRLKGIIGSQAVLLFPTLLALFIFIRTYLRKD